MPFLARGAALLAVAVAFSGCAQAPLNVKLVAYDPAAGYRYRNLTGGADTDDLFVILAFSGGGPRAAAFSFGLLEGLRAVDYSAPGGPRRLLDDVEVISSVSGGSFTAAYYALFRERAFTEFPKAFLYRNIEGALLRRALSPANWLRLGSPHFSRIDLAAELYDEEVFEGKTFADLLRDGRKPYVILNATDMTLGTRFEFTQDQFDLLCSDLGPEKMARGVAASSAFPVLLTALTVKNFAVEGCGYRYPRWLENALRPEGNPARRYGLARDLASYQAQARERDFIHLLDGGLADNIGLRGPYVALSSNDSGWSVLTRINQRKIRRVIVITANAKTKQRHQWDRRESAPGLLDVMGFVTSGPMDAYSFDTVQLVRDLFDQQAADFEAWRACKSDMQQVCPAAQMQGVLPPVDFHAVELSFDALRDDEALRRCLEQLPTTFALPAAQVTLLRQVARHLLMGSAELQRAMAAIAPGWQPPAAPIDPAVRREACGG